MGLLTLVLGLIGMGARRRAIGILVDEYGRGSLSRFQACMWTIVVVPALAVVVAWNLARGPLTPPNAPKGTPPSYADAFGVTLPPRLWALLGISAATLVAAGVTREQKLARVVGLRPQDSSSGRDETPLPTWQYQGNLATHPDPSQADLGDLFYAESVPSAWPKGDVAPPLDLNRARQALLSMVTVVAHGLILAKMLYGNGWISSFPGFSDGAVALLTISHASCLVAKAAADPSTAASSGTNRPRAPRGTNPPSRNGAQEEEADVREARAPTSRARTAGEPPGGGTPARWALADSRGSWRRTKGSTRGRTPSSCRVS